MEELCKSKGPWTRFAYVNMSNPTHQYPPRFRLYASNGIRACDNPLLVLVDVQLMFISLLLVKGIRKCVVQGLITYMPVQMLFITNQDIVIIMMVLV